MKSLRYLVAAALLLGVSSIANAFTFQVLDPNKPLKNAPVITSFNTAIDFSFYQCPSFIDPSGTDITLGCFAAVNGTDANIGSFSATISSTKPMSPVDCSTDGAYGLSGAFTEDSCSLSADDLTLTADFSGGDIAPGSTIWLVEDGVSIKDFKKDAGSFSVAATPEPSSIWLGLSGLGSIGYALRRRRRVRAA